MTKTRIRGLALLLAGSATLTACASVPDLGVPPQIRAPEQLASRESLHSPAAQWPSSAWWSAYGDPQLDRLIGEALTAAPDLQVAAARMRQARGQKRHKLCRVRL